MLKHWIFAKNCTVLEVSKIISKEHKVNTKYKIILYLNEFSIENLTFLDWEKETNEQKRITTNLRKFQDVRNDTYLLFFFPMMKKKKVNLLRRP
jgi:hypothetical protein